MTRELTGHKVNPANDQIEVTALDAIGSGGAHHSYRLQIPNVPATYLNFQDGPIGEAGVNGITHEALLAVLVDRLECFQAGPYANPYNGEALAHLRCAQTELQARTRERMARGVEGTHNK